MTATQPTASALTAPHAPRTGDRRRYWIIAGLLGLALIGVLGWDIHRPFEGLHSWGEADRAWLARNHARYGLDYTQGLLTIAVGDPPTDNPIRYVNHPPLNLLIYATGPALFGEHVWSVRVIEILFSVLTLWMFLKLLWNLVGWRVASVAGLMLVAFPLTQFWGLGNTMLPGLAIIWLYLRLIGRIKPDAPPRPYHLTLFGVIIVVMLLMSWATYFFPMAIGVHHLASCVRRRRGPHWATLGVLVGASIAGGCIVLGIMLAAWDWDVERLINLYRWRASGAPQEGGAATTWSVWWNALWSHARTNFTIPALVLAGVGWVSHVIGRFATREQPDAAAPRRDPWAASTSALLWLLFLPAAFQLLLLRGALVPHQYFESVLMPVLALLAGIGVWAVALVLGRSQRLVGAAGAGAVVVGTLVACVNGAMHYHAIVWQRPEKIAVWQQLNDWVPADKPLLTFDAVADSLISIESEAKGPVYRAEPAWYIDRRIHEAKYPQQIFRLADSGQYPVYLLPVGMRMHVYDRGLDLYIARLIQRGLMPLTPQQRRAMLEPRQYLNRLVMYQQWLQQLLSRCFESEFHPSIAAEQDEQGRTMKFGMRAYAVIRLDRPRADAPDLPMEQLPPLPEGVEADEALRPMQRAAKTDPSQP